MKPIIPTLENPTRNSIIELVANTSDVKTWVFNQCTEHPEFQEDLYQELFMALLKGSEENLINIYQKGKLTPLIIGIIKNMVNSNSSPFHRLYRKPKLSKVNQKNISRFEEDEEYSDITDFHTDIQQIELNKIDIGEIFIDQALEVFNDHVERLDGEYAHFDKKLLKQYLKENNNQSQVNRIYGIHRGYIGEGIQRIKKSLRKSIEEEVTNPDEILPEDNIYIPPPPRREAKDVKEINQLLYNSEPIRKPKKKK